jgi:hypothetical protein
MILDICSPMITTTIGKSYPPLDYREDVIVFGLRNPVPENAEELGIVEIGDSGFSTILGNYGN